MVGAFRAMAQERGFGAVIACVRPSLKVRYPLMRMEDYVAWRRPDGLPFDAWLRVHARAGGEIVRVAPGSMRIDGRIAEWRDWTGLEFPASGPYVVAGRAGAGRGGRPRRPRHVSGRQRVGHPPAVGPSTVAISCARHGEVAERLMAAVLKTAERKLRGFESHPLRHANNIIPRAETRVC